MAVVEERVAERLLVPSDAIDVVRRKVSDWLDATLPRSWPDGNRATVERWWRDLYHRAGLATPTWPVELGGLGLSDEAASVVNEVLVERHAPVPYNLVTVQMIGAVLMTLGTPEQRRRYLPPLASREEVWCQLFSEPGAGSDLASLACRAARDGDSWVVSGQKLWSSFASEAARGLLLARTDPSLPKRKGITAFAVDMRTPGIDVRPLRQMTGDAHFCEVFFDNVVVPDDDRIGEPNRGWDVAGAMLAAERGMLGGPGTSPVARIGGIDIDDLLELLPGLNPGLRDRLLRCLVDDRVVGMLGVRLHARPELSSLVKLAQAEHNQRLQSLAAAVLGPSTVAHERHDSHAARVSWGVLRSRANTVAGGTSEVMRTVLGERVLGLPKEPDPYRGRPWSRIPR
jgi:alkylation response protein AidB-like acyl-CoA dehydrogenase